MDAIDFEQRSRVVMDAAAVVARVFLSLALAFSYLDGHARREALEGESPPGPLYGYQANPPNDPKAVVSAMLARGLKNLGRYTGWNEVEYTPLFESFPPYIVTRTKGDDGKVHERQDVLAFGRCAQQMTVKSAKATKLEQAPDPLSPVTAPRGLKNEDMPKVREGAKVALVRTLVGPRIQTFTTD